MSLKDKDPSDACTMQATVVGVGVIVAISVALICFFSCSCTPQIKEPFNTEDIDIGIHSSNDKINHCAFDS